MFHRSNVGKDEEVHTGAVCRRSEVGRLRAGTPNEKNERWFMSTLHVRFSRNTLEAENIHEKTNNEQAKQTNQLTLDDPNVKISNGAAKMFVLEANTADKQGPMFSLAFIPKK
jgi:hypothetical protein